MKSVLPNCWVEAGTLKFRKVLLNIYSLQMQKFTISISNVRIFLSLETIESIIEIVNTRNNRVSNKRYTKRFLTQHLYFEVQQLCEMRDRYNTLIGPWSWLRHVWISEFSIGIRLSKKSPHLSNNLFSLFTLRKENSPVII